MSVRNIPKIICALPVVSLIELERRVACSESTGSERQSHRTSQFSNFFHPLGGLKL